MNLLIKLHSFWIIICELLIKLTSCRFICVMTCITYAMCHISYVLTRISFTSCHISCLSDLHSFICKQSKFTYLSDLTVLLLLMLLLHCNTFHQFRGFTYSDPMAMYKHSKRILSSTFSRYLWLLFLLLFFTQRWQADIIIYQRHNLYKKL